MRFQTSLWEFLELLPSNPVHIMRNLDLCFSASRVNLNINDLPSARNPELYSLYVSLPSIPSFPVEQSRNGPR